MPDDPTLAALLDPITERVARMFDGTFDQQLVARVVEDCYSELSKRASTPIFVPLLAERFARERLDALKRSTATNAPHSPAVLFLCTHNAGRSQMALGWFNHLAEGRAIAWSGGSEPGAEVNPSAVEAMAEVGIDITGEYPKPWTEEVVRAADVVVLMGCGDSCPVYPGTRYVDWELPDPAGMGVEAVRPIRDEIEAKVRALLGELGVTVV